MAGTSGVGKSSLAVRIGQALNAAVIDYDVVKSAALDAGTTWDMSGRVGYKACHAIADSLLEQGVSVILDSPCRFQFIVDRGGAIAAKRGIPYAFIECVLQDGAELTRRMQARKRHRSQRVSLNIPPPDSSNDPIADETGKVSIPKTQLPPTPWLQVDTRASVEHCLQQALEYLETL